ncbi:hypothetical protein TNCV_944151 [Trichonephila clavipes]|nr:hypothetical protein TNCV_944151 [Trichonephila clavipes]
MALVSPTENPKRNVNASCPTLDSPVNKSREGFVFNRFIYFVDLCSNNPCQNGGSCEIKGASFMCQCKSSYFGQNCERDPCTDQPCLNGGICKLHKDTFKCYCKEPFFGTKCEIVDPVQRCLVKTEEYVQSTATALIACANLLSLERNVKKWIPVQRCLVKTEEYVQSTAIALIACAKLLTLERNAKMDPVQRCLVKTEGMFSQRRQL